MNIFFVVRDMSLTIEEMRGMGWDQKSIDHHNMMHKMNVTYDWETDIGNLKVVHCHADHRIWLVWNGKMRRVGYRADGKIRKWKYIHVGQAWDHATNIKVDTKHCKSVNGAEKHALENLCKELHRRNIW